MRKKYDIVSLVFVMYFVGVVLKWFKFIGKFCYVMMLLTVEIL